ncbi:DUF4199 domain-containing protein [Sphingomonas sp.]|uniref:DUF4199 domain-containing protein n=1 Tax=Sphingomonas sp. TaxID=28214 RepID=UPI0033424264
MMQKIVGYGAIAGLVAGGAVSLTALGVGDHSIGGWGMAIGYLIMLAALSTIFVAIKRQRDVAGGGVIGFWSAFGLGAAISVVASLVYALCWDAALAIGHIQFGHSYAASTIAEAKSRGMTPDALAKLTAEMTRFAEKYDGSILYRLPMSMMEILPVGLVVSLVSAWLLWKGLFLPVRASGEASA